MRAIHRTIRLAAGLVLAASTLGPGARAEPPEDAEAVARRLAELRGAARISPLIELTELRRDQPAEVLALTEEVLRLLAAHPSPLLEARARIARSQALEERSDYAAAAREATRAEALAHDDAALFASATLRLGTVQWRMAEYDAALAHAERARDLLEPRGPSDALARSLSLIGAIHHATGDLEGGLQGYLAALQVGDALGDEIVSARAHNNVGLVYLDLGRGPEGIAALERALEIHERLGPRANLTNTLNNVGMALVDLDRPREAIPYLERALAMDREVENLYGEAKDLSNLGYAHEKLELAERALAYHDQALALRERIVDKPGIVVTTGALAEVRLGMGDARAAIPLLERSIALATEIGDPRARSRHLRLLAEARAAAGDSAGAYLTYRSYHDAQAALSDDAERKHIAELELRYETRAREREVAELARVAESRRSAVGWLALGSVLLAVSLALLGGSYVLRGRAQRALAESEQRYRALFHGTLAPAFLIDCDTRRIVDLNEPTRALCDPDGGTTPGTVDDIKPEWIRRALSGLFAAGADGALAADDEHLDEAGRSRWTETRGSAVSLSGRAALLATVRDVTEARRREESRQREDRIESLGVLAGGIAHDFNNALMGILGHVSLAKDASPSEARALLDAAENATFGASHLTGQLLAFAKGGQPVRRAMHVAPLLKDALALASAGSPVRVQLDIAEALWPAEIDPGKFQQVINNLVLNALQASGAGLTIPGGMGGAQAIAEIRRIEPHVRAIVASGYSNDPTLANHREAGFAAALVKPFRRDTLGRVVRSVLAPGGSATDSPER